MAPFGGNGSADPTRGQLDCSAGEMIASDLFGTLVCRGDWRAQEKENDTMPARSQSQQKAAGAALAAKRGEIPEGRLEGNGKINDEEGAGGACVHEPQAFARQEGQVLTGARGAGTGSRPVPALIRPSVTKERKGSRSPSTDGSWIERDSRLGRHRVPVL